jgi:NADH-quinone oxidoreductase subunit J
MDPTIPYLACVVGAAALYALLRPGPSAPKIAAGVVGLGAFAWMLVAIADFAIVGNGSTTGQATRPDLFFVIFTLIAIASAVRMITHPKPVYSALYFIMVVLSSAALFLLLEAEFMAFALVIVYAGAILITYMFVLMLAQQTPTDQSQPDYDATPREPGYAAVVGFVMLAVFTHMIFGQSPSVPPQPTARQAALQAWADLERMPRRIEDRVHGHDPHAKLVPDAQGKLVRFEGPAAFVVYSSPASDSQQRFLLMPEHVPSNIERVGLDLVSRFPVSLELAGIILLMAMFGAVVLARKQIELGEDEIREAAGMRRLDFHADEPHATSTSGTPAGGAS